MKSSSFLAQIRTSHLDLCEMEISVTLCPDLFNSVWLASKLSFTFSWKITQVSLFYASLISLSNFRGNFCTVTIAG